MQNILNSFRLFKEKEDHKIVFDNIDKGIVFKGTNLWILIFAIFIASLGLNVNSTAVIIGAMLISPLMGPIMGMGLSLGINDLDMFRRAIYNYGFATIVGLITSTIYFFLSPINDAHSELLARTQPNIYDVLIAFFGGLAGILAISSKQKGNVIPGVAIATALMPPLCTAGFGLATGEFQFFIGAFYLYLINTVFISLATLITVKYLRYPVNRFEDEKKEKRNRQWISAIIIVTLLPSIYFGYKIVEQSKFNDTANKFIDRYSKLPNEYLLNKKINPKERAVTLVYGGAKLTNNQIDQLKSNFKKFDFRQTDSLIINQGFSYLTEKSKDDFSTTILTQNKNLIQGLQLTIDSLNRYNAISPNLFKEIKSFNLDISSFSIQSHMIVGDSIDELIPICIINSVKPLKDEKIQQLNNFLKARLHLDSLLIINK